MKIIYECRHCKEEIGKLEETVIDTSLLGLDELTREEKEEMMEYGVNGDLKIYAICDACEDTLRSHPHYHEFDYFIH